MFFLGSRNSRKSRKKKGLFRRGVEKGKTSGFFLTYFRVAAPIAANSDAVFCFADFAVLICREPPQNARRNENAHAQPI